MKMNEVGERTRVAALLRETITTLCRKGLKFQTEFSIEGLLGITLDNKDIFLVNIKEIVKTAENGCNEEYDMVPNAVLNYTQIMQKPEEIFPKRRKKRKSSTVSKRKVVYSDSKSPTISALTNHFNLESPSPLKSLDDHLMNDPLSGKLRNPFGDIPQFSDTDFALSCDDGIKLAPGDFSNHSTAALCKDDGEQFESMQQSCDDGIKLAPGDFSNHSAAALYKDDSEQFDSLQQSPSISFADGIPLDLGLPHCDTNSLGDDWSNTIDVPLNLSEVKPVTAKEEKMFPCDGCRKTYKSEYNLKKHRCKSVAGTSPPPLGEGSQPLDLSVPMAAPRDSLDSLDLDTELNIDDLNEQYMCICSRAFTDYPAYVDHVVTCHKAKLTPYKACEICGKYFFSNSGYVKHKRLHMGAYKFRCDVCWKGFFDRTHLRAHMDSSHSKVRRYECQHCCKSFFWKHHLKRHLGTCDRAKPVPEAAATATAEGQDE